MLRIGPNFVLETRSSSLEIVPHTPYLTGPQAEFERDN